MTTEQTLYERSGRLCELCRAADHLSIYQIPPGSDTSAETSALLCSTCQHQIDDPSIINTHHWRCLNDSMWSATPAIQVLAWRQLNQLSEESWAQDALEMLYLEEDVLNWAKAMDKEVQETTTPTLDSNGAELKAGDTVTLIKDLDVKGAGFTAKRGTAVRNISLTDNSEHIEGRVNGVRVVLISKFLKKTN